jgi:hypothetical protein
MEILMVEFTSNIEQCTSTVEVADIGNARIAYEDKSGYYGKSFSLEIKEEINYLSNYNYSINCFGEKTLSSAVAKKLAVFITHLHTLNEQEQLNALNIINGDNNER